MLPHPVPLPEGEGTCTLRSFPRLPERPGRQHLDHPAAKLCRAVDVCWWLNRCGRNLSSFLDRALFSPVTFHRFLNLSDEQRGRMRSAHCQRRGGTSSVLIKRQLAGYRSDGEVPRPAAEFLEAPYRPAGRHWKTHLAEQFVRLDRRR